MNAPGDIGSGFPSSDGACWLNTAHQGILPRAAAEAAHEAVARKQEPWRIDNRRFVELPARLRGALAGVLGVPAEEVVLANSASYGLHLLANGLPWQAGDEVLVLDGDFPSDILPWLGLESLGVRVRGIRPRRGPVIQPDDLAAAIGPRTRLLCTTWVHSFSGWTVDLEALGAICRERGVTFVVNASQGLGARRLDLAGAPVDALVSVGWKWLCGPYGTGFLWLRPELLERLRYNKTYWVAYYGGAAGLEGPAEEVLDQDLGARRYDLFATANFFNFEAWLAAIEHLVGIGVERIEAHDQALVERLIEGVDRDGWQLRSPESGAARSTLVFLSHREPERNPAIYRELRRRGIHGALREGRVRLSPHLYNRAEEVDRAANALMEIGTGQARSETQDGRVP